MKPRTPGGVSTKTVYSFDFVEGRVTTFTDALIFQEVAPPPHHITGTARRYFGLADIPGAAINPFVAMSIFFKPPCDAAQIAAASPAIGEERGSDAWVLAVTILGSSMAFIDSTVVNVALPVLQSDLHASMSDVQWVVESYALLLTALMLVGGSLGDQIGRRTTFAVGVVVFSAASACCGFSPDIHFLILARALQGVGAALLIPGSLALLSDSFPEQQRGRAIGTWSGFSGITAAVGPVLGGWFVQELSWRWAFFINLPIGAVVLFLLFLRIPHDKATTRRNRIDWVGAGIVTVSLASLVYGLLELPARGSDAITVGTLIGGSIGIAAFVFVEAKRKAPMMPVDIFRSRTFTGANLLTLFLYAGMSGALFFLPFNFIQVQGYSPLQSGSALLPFVVIMFVLSPWAGGLVARFGSRLPLTIGPLVAALGFVLFAVPSVGGSYWRTFFAGISILGLGMATSVAPLTTTVMNSVGQDRVGAASGINNAVARLAGVLAIALLGIVMQTAFAAQLSRRLAALNLPVHVQETVNRQRGRLAAIDLPASLDDSLRTRIRGIIDESFVAAFRHVVLICAALAALSSLTAVLTMAATPRNMRSDAP